MKLLKLSLLAMVLAFTFACADDEASEFNSNKPTASVTKGGMSYDINQTIVFNSSTVAEEANRTVLKINSTAESGLKVIEVVLSSEQSRGQELFETLNPLNLFNPALASGVSQLKLLLPQAVVGAHSVDIDLSFFADFYIAMIDASDNVTLDFTITDANGTTTQSVVVNVIPDLFVSDPSAIITVSNSTSDNISVDNLTLEQLTTDNITVNIVSDNDTLKINTMGMMIVTDNATATNVISNFFANNISNSASMFTIVGGFSLFDTAVLNNLGITLPDGANNSTEFEFVLNPLITALLDVVADYDPNIVVSQFELLIMSGNSFSTSENKSFILNIERPININFFDIDGANATSDTLSPAELTTSTIEAIATTVHDTTNINYATLSVTTDNSTANTAINNYIRDNSNNGGYSPNEIDLFDSLLISNLGVTLTNVIKGSNYIEFDMNPILVKLLDIVAADDPSTVVSSFTLTLDVGASDNSIDSKEFTLNISRLL